MGEHNGSTRCRILEKKARRNAHHLCVLKLNLLLNYISKDDAVARGYSALLESLAIRSPKGNGREGGSLFLGSRFIVHIISCSTISTRYPVYPLYHGDVWPAYTGMLN